MIFSLFPHANKRLTGDQSAAVERCIAAVKAKREGGMVTEDLPDGSQAYAYPQGHGAVAWGVNDATGMNIARDVRK
jgi:hypothetical protein